MTKFLPVMGILLAGAAVPLAAQPTMTQEYEAVSQPDVVDSTTQATDLRFKRDEYDRMTVPVRVGGSGPYRFLIDTGADRTAISSVIARHLNLRDRSGVALWLRMREDVPQLADRVLFISGSAPGDPLWDAARETGRPVLAKPFDVRQLVGLVRQFRAGG